MRARFLGRGGVDVCGPYCVVVSQTIHAAARDADIFDDVELCESGGAWGEPSARDDAGIFDGAALCESGGAWGEPLARSARDVVSAYCESLVGHVARDLSNKL